MAEFKTNLRWDLDRQLWRHMNYVCFDVTRRGPTNAWVAKCRDCGGEAILRFARGICPKCMRGYAKRLKQIAGPAHRKVFEAVKKGILPKLDGAIPCADCGRPAQVYDHRDYSRPLDVVPVCKRCNIRRGPAEQTAPLWRKKLSSRLTPGSYAATPDLVDGGK